MTDQTFLFGIDGLDPELLLAWTAAGELPNLKRLTDHAVSVELQNRPNLSETAWPNFYSGTNPGQYGRYFNSQITPGTYKTHPVTAEHYPRNPYWEQLDGHGQRAIVIDVPKSRLSELQHGIHMVNWGIHDQETDVGFGVFPRHLESRLGRQYGKDPVAPNDYGGDGPGDVGAFVAALKTNVDRRTRLVEDLLEQEHWDHFLVVFDDMHAISHYTWHVHDPDHPDHDAALRNRIGDPLLATCKALDDALGRVRNLLGESTRLGVVTTMGMGPNYHATAALDEVLRRFQGKITARSKPISRLRDVWRKLPLRWQHRLLPLQNAARNALLGRDRKRRESFALPASDDAGVIRVNLVGREPAGVIQPGAGYEQYLARVTEQLESLRNTDTGSSVVADVCRVAEHCSGERLDWLPDLIVTWARQEPVRSVVAMGIDPVILPPTNSRTGSHTAGGRLWISTPEQRRQVLATPMRLVDFAPTICEWHGVPFERFDGCSQATRLP